MGKDPFLGPYRRVLARRIEAVERMQHRLTGGKTDLADFASGHEYFGLHRKNDRWVFREWAPHATALYLVGDRTGWRPDPAYCCQKINDDGVWELTLAGDALAHGDYYQLFLKWPEGEGTRIPTYARRVVQDPDTLLFSAQVWAPPPYRWRCPDFRRSDDTPLIYEAHVGMAQEKQGVGTYAEFAAEVLPRIVEAGYTTLQLMAVQQHPYYGSFGYQVSSFFAASSRFGTPEQLKALIDAAHMAGLSVIMDLVHSHAVSNEVEGLSRFDGTLYQFFHEGPRGIHGAWGSRCFDYGKVQVLHFLLSNCRFWLDEYRLDGFRFDGITSMLYLDHGLEKAFGSYEPYFDAQVDEEALTYLALANRVIHRLRPDAMTIAEDISGMPGLAAPAKEGGVGFDYRFAMGIPDYWIRLVKETPDEQWPMGHVWYELTNRRAEEKTISYAESHDQALVGDQTLMFRLSGSAIYDHMTAQDGHNGIARAMALHKIVRLITLATAGSGYLNFMGNEFGHPDWIDFPRQENGWSYLYARRQWHLVDDPALKYRWLARFDADMIALTRQTALFSHCLELVRENDVEKVIAFRRGPLVFAFNFHPTVSHVNYPLPLPGGKYRLVLDSDSAVYGGHQRLAVDQIYHSLGFPEATSMDQIRLYLPTRTALVLCRETRPERADIVSEPCNHNRCL